MTSDKPKLFKQVLNIGITDSVYYVHNEEGFLNACRDVFHHCNVDTNDIPTAYPALVRISIDLDASTHDYVFVKKIHAPDFITRNPVVEQCQTLTLDQLINGFGSATCSSVWDAISDTKEEADEMKALSEATIWVMDYHYRTALNDVSDGVMKKVLIGKVSQLSMKDLYRVMWLNKLHTKELDEICTKYEQSIPKKEHYQ